MSEIYSRPFGKITVNDSDIIVFPDGLFGFDSLNRFILLEEKESPMVWLQSYEEADLAFVLLRIVHFMSDYELSMSQSDLEALGTDDTASLDVYAILTIPEDDPSRMTANLMGPVVINPAEKIGRQVISLSDRYRTKHSVLEELKRKKEA